MIVTITPSEPNIKNTPTGTPTGTIANSSPTDFLLAPGKPAAFLFSTIDGTIAGWNPTVAVAQGAAPPSTQAVTVVKTSDGSSYTGLTSAFIEGNRFLYAANFTKGRVDVYDNAFHLVNLRKQHFNEDSADHDNARFETDGPGLGFVDIFSSTGQLLQRLEHGDWLNAPWGVALAPLDFGRFSHDLLIGQFAGGGDTQSSGFLAAYDLSTGKFDGLLQDASGKPLAINGIWALSPGNVSPANSDAAAAPAAQVYFTAGPNHGSGGLFGFLAAVSSELTEGNAQ